MQIFRQPSYPLVIRLLDEAGLPFSDLSAEQMSNFLAYGTTTELQAVIGLEPYGENALLRSFAVAPKQRNKGIGNALLIEAERYVFSCSIKNIYLLTTGAEQYFARAGYEKVSRESAASAIKQTQEFSRLCPASAALMVKRF